ncbi:D-serine/D-alanine/glycine transporter [Brucella anthropi]|jgi:D-serine/D-alanine/glycine transporter|uniref:D-serine/D-alanine/glycine transporter n=1 Tax=Brucella anthropi TaxID=529 RepID=A0A011UC96_BRUAN|nr:MULTISPECIES: D-serine/D-alanine/glycine transporter [Brucella/Ochrobactrum group]QOD66161.1 D-serine/D-alanine/glycine transporter [Ochrobactrum sp. MT180101]QTN04261.1 D-serine/D-alanine/glycine transporter [Ochrobactrum sp. EEELCW01]EXL03558.1 amino acid transporter [Brucella anthropi]KAB2732824.1 D-serine/D-alanine/glycine transporter [Brucella anthropi]KAB2756439.1 D-serine/D-alanine/glycine transporter [Brucella anthropi]
MNIASKPSVDPHREEEPHLARNLSNRHLQLIAIGGAIGTGLFMGSGKTISLAGPSILLVYAVIGFMLFFVMRALGEILLSNLEYRSFADFAGDYLGPWAQFFTGWTYWLCWIVTGVADVVAVSGYVSFWFPELALWIPALGLIFTLLALNLPTVRNFGEIEFWFALIKIVAIVGLIIAGVYMLSTGFTLPNGSQASVAHLWNHGGFFPNGFLGFVAGFQIAVFAFVGIELVGTAAAETKDPERNLPKAINSIPIRVVLFYLGALFVIITVIPWDQVDPNSSPFVAMFSLAGLGIAAHVVNFVVLTSATSSANSGIYSTSRMIYGLATSKLAPKALAKLNKRQVPVNSLFFSCVFLLAGVVLLYAGQSIIEAFTIVTTISALLFIFIWSIILASYLQYRRKRPDLHEKSTFKMPGGRAAVVMVFAFFAFILWALAQEPDTAAALKVTPLWFVLLAVAYLVMKSRRSQG